MSPLFIASATLAAPPHPLVALPFVVLLAAIAVMPFVSHHWWETHYPKVSVVLGSAVAVYYLFWLRDYERLLHTAQEYLGFMALVGSLYVVAGGIHIGVRGQTTPLVNCAVLVFGAVLANVVGTTGASLLLIRPFIQLNRLRVNALHVVFFIFIVSNAGGCLTPIGDPPLFVGYLKGVPFWWVLKHCWAAWLIVVAGLVGIFYVLDTRNFRAVPPAVRDPATAEETWQVRGLRNLGFLAVVLAAVFIPDVSAWAVRKGSVSSRAA